MLKNILSNKLGGVGEIKSKNMGNCEINEDLVNKIVYEKQ